jgi:hypothetical protein
MHWFNPLLWLGLHRLRADRELVCDAMVLQRTRPEEQSSYGGLLLKLLGDFPAGQRMIPTAIPVVSSKSEIKSRIVSIKHHRRASLAACLATGTAAVALVCLTFTRYSTQQHSTSTPLTVADSGGVKTKLDQIGKDFGVSVAVRGHGITFGGPGTMTVEEYKQEWKRIQDAVHNALGNDFTNYTIMLIVD